MLQPLFDMFCQAFSVVSSNHATASLIRHWKLANAFCPVAAKIAFVTAGVTAEVPASPIPPGGSPALHDCRPRFAGASLIRSTGVNREKLLLLEHDHLFSVIFPCSAAVTPER